MADQLEQQETSRMLLQQTFEAILGNGNVYFQPPPSLLMKYPCIKYDLQSKDFKYSGNKKYLIFDRYSVTLMDANPDSEYVDALLELPYCRFDRKYKVDQLSHYVFDCYITKE